MPYGRELTEEEADDLFRDADQILASRTAPRKRATNHQMEERAQFLIKYAYVHGPVTVRQLFYRAEVEGLPGVEKTNPATSRFNGKCSICAGREDSHTSRSQTQLDGCVSHTPSAIPHSF
jgi:hypothetical protein